MHCSFKATLLHIHNMDENIGTTHVQNTIRKCCLKDQGTKCAKYCNTTLAHCPR